MAKINYKLNPQLTFKHQLTITELDNKRRAALEKKIGKTLTDKEWHNFKNAQVRKHKE